MKIVIEKYPGIMLECYGRDNKNILPKLAEKFNVTGNVKVNGFIDYENVTKVFNKKSIFVLSSLYESQNMSLIEAAFCGVPLISTNVGIAGEITENIAEAGNYQSLAEKIIYVIENYANEKQKALSKREKIVNKYSLKNTTTGFIQLYKMLISNPPSFAFPPFIQRGD